MMNALKRLRKKIDQIDIKIIDLLSQRFATVMDIGRYKKEHDIPRLDEKRRKELLQSHIHRAKQKGLSEKLITDLRERIHKETLDLQQ